MPLTPLSIVLDNSPSSNAAHFLVTNSALADAVTTDVERNVMTVKHIAPHLSQGELMMWLTAKSLLGRAQVNLWEVVAKIDSDNAEAVVEAVAILAGVEEVTA